MLYHRIARELGGMTVQEMLERISSEEIADWMVIFQDEDEKARKK